MTATGARQRGFALLVVLWTLALLSLIATTLIGSARERAVAERLLADSSALEAAVDGALQHAIFALLDQSPAHWPADDAIHAVRIGRITVTVRIEDEARKINPNIASLARLRGLLEQSAVAPPDAASLAAAIVAWRTPGPRAPSGLGGSGVDDRPAGAPFAHLDELAEVPGMTPDLLRRLRPFLTLFTDDDTDDTTQDNADAGGRVRICGITATARGADRTMFTKHIIVRTNARRTGRRYEVLSSDQIVVDKE